MKEAVLRLPWCRNASNQHDTGHSTDPTPTAAMAEQPPQAGAIRQHVVHFGHKYLGVCASAIGQLAEMQFQERIDTAIVDRASHA